MTVFETKMKWSNYYQRLKRTSVITRAVCCDVCVTDNTTTTTIATPKILIARQPALSWLVAEGEQDDRFQWIDDRRGWIFRDAFCGLSIFGTPQTPLLIALTQARLAVGRRAGQAREEAELRQSTTA
ncbi:hypothetical protein Tsp_03698 [Trichinella spiralis]|uniref:hypothetical protein n=1 Tax=Trichinella spiralis TaxID=6334 RepID=UPI0001EFB923|nr:hypothetical protein Tsp_03698 [Trichinella spiralis]